MATLFKDDDFLCEKCGYVLNGLGPEANCSECGKPAYESHPERRVGNAWQRKRGVKNYFATIGQHIRHPFRSFESAQLVGKGSIQFAIICCFIATFGSILLSYAYGYSTESVLIESVDVREILLVGIITSVLVAIGWFFLLVLVGIEYCGIRFFGNRKQYRISRINACVICGYSTPGWIVGYSLAFLFSWITLFLLFSLWITSESDIRNSVSKLAVVVFDGSWLVGMLWFETLVYIGMRKMKFANPPEAAPPWSIEDALRARGERDTPSADKSASPPAGERAVEIAEVVREPEALGDDTMGA
jgi:hypothetical protein